MTTPLDGLRILDLTNVVMGPYATQVLADYGADVIKVETPAGDTTRQIPPMRNPDMGTTFLHLNRNKRSVVLDLREPDGRDAFLTLADSCDAFISNVRPAGLARLGIDYATLSARNARLIWVGLTGFGEDGPYAGRPAYDDLIQSLTAVPDMLVRTGSDHPHFVPLAFNDRAVGLHAAVALLAAVHQRASTGVGQQIDIPMYETMAQFTLGDHMGGHTFEPPIGPPGYQRTLNPARHPYRTLDGYITAIVYTDAHWRSFFDLVGRSEEFSTDPRVATLRSRTEHSEALYREVGEAVATGTTQEWLARFDAADIPAAPVHSLESAIYDEHLERVGFFRLAEHPTEGLVREMAIPSRWPDVSFPAPRPAPSLGQHTVEVLREAGVSSEVIARLESPAASAEHCS
ncbi:MULTISPECIES: CaiB/BaiF CoA transferase family protein [Arsenicicoccus]|uniref:CaiB/BaiF CoA transferase family protein n=1 Tax=Arsenicicoccus TaxID=267408 RepID=UPI00257EA4B6|nr:MULTISPECIES: CoA transferase [Arsenicicoccus]